jgi:thiol-disulfide isomerase/thioredoxin
MKSIFKNRSFRNNALFLIVLSVVLYATGYHVRVYSGLKNTLIRTGIITPRTVTAVDFEQATLSPETLAGLKLVDEQGRQTTLGDFGQEVLLINVWASWCPPCVAEMPGLNTLYEAEKEAVGFVMITWDKSMEAAQNYRDRNGYSFPIYKSVGPVPPPFQTGSIPTTFVADQRQKTLYRHSGMIAFDDPQMRKFLQSLGE